MTYERMRQVVNNDPTFRKDINELYRRIIRHEFGKREVISYASEFADRHGMDVQMFPGFVLVFTMRSARSMLPASIVVTMNAGGQYPRRGYDPGGLSMTTAFACLDVYHDNDFDVAGLSEGSANGGKSQGGALRQ